MEQFGRGAHVGTVGLAEGLVAQAHPEHRHARVTAVADDVEAIARAAGVPGSGRDEDAVVGVAHVTGADLVVAHHLDGGAEFSDVLNDVVDE